MTLYIKFVVKMEVKFPLNLDNILVLTWLDIELSIVFNYEQAEMD